LLRLLSSVLNLLAKSIALHYVLKNKISSMKKNYLLVRSCRKYWFDAFLIVLILIFIMIMFLSSSDPIPVFIVGTTTQNLLKQYQSVNPIAFDLSVGFLSGFFMYYLVVRLPEQGKRRRLRANLEKAYKSFKKDSIAIYLGCFMSSYPAGLPMILSERTAFRKFFNEPHGPGQDRWHAVANGLDDYRLKTLVVELEILMQEIHFTLSAIDVEDSGAFQFLKNLSKIIYRSKNWSTEYDDVKSMMRFLWALHSGWDMIEGYPEVDPVAMVIAEI
jgi:hypothetical protein